MRKPAPVTRLSLRAVQQAAAQKPDGYLDAVLAEVVRRDGDYIYISVDAYERLRNQYPKRAGLGDMVASALSAVGITKERVSKLLGRPCGCGARAEALNRLGEKLGIGGKPAKDA